MLNDIYTNGWKHVILKLQSLKSKIGKLRAKVQKEEHWSQTTSVRTALHHSNGGARMRPKGEDWQIPILGFSSIFTL